MGTYDEEKNAARAYLIELYREYIPSANELRVLNNKISAIQEFRDALITAASNGQMGIKSLEVSPTKFYQDDLGGVLANEKGYKLENWDSSKNTIDISWD